MLEFEVSGQRLIIKRQSYTAADSMNYLTAGFRFSKDWTGLGKTAVFKNADRSEVYNVMVGSDGTCTVPSEVIHVPKFYVSVYSGGNVRITTNDAEVLCNASGYGEGTVPEDPTPSVYDQLLDELNKRLTADGDASDVTVEFDVAAEKENIASGETLRRIFGKIAGWFSYVGGVIGEKLQADWLQTDISAEDYIKNKPTALSQFENDEEFVSTGELNMALGNKLDKSETAAKAQQLATARSINGVGFDGTADITVSDRKYCMVGSDTVSGGWYKVAEQTMSGNSNINVTFMVTFTYSRYYSGVFQLQMRSDTTRISCQTASWLIRRGFPVDGIRIVIDGMKYSVYIKQYALYGKAVFEVLSESTNTSGNTNIKLFTSSTPEAAEPVATVTSSDGGTVLQALQDGLGRVISDTYALIQDARSTPYDTGRVWLNGSPIMRMDFCVKIKNASAEDSDKSVLWSNINFGLHDVCVVNAQVFGSLTDASVNYIGNVDFVSVDFNNSGIMFDSPQLSSYDTVMLYGYVEYVTMLDISDDNITKVFE